MAKSKASPTQYSRDKTSASSEKAWYKPLPSLHPYSSRSENGKTFDKETRKEKKKEGQRRLRSLVIVSTTSTLMTGALCYPGTRSLHLIPGSSAKRSRSHDGHNSHGGLNDQNSHDGYKGFDNHDGFDSHNNHDSHDKFNAPGQPGKDLIIPEDFLLADASIVSHLQQCKHTVCKKGACLDNLHSRRRPFDLKKLVTVTLEAYD